ncbi:MAG: hypothetical protein ACRENP_09490 [Longimicrobiales bacterium]
MAYLLLYYQVLMLQRSQRARLGIDAAIMGERRVLLGLPPLPCPRLGLTGRHGLDQLNCG